jgi:VanZ family protein
MWHFKRFITRWWPTVAVTCAILYLTLTSHPPKPDGIKLFEGADKVVHFLMMAGLTATAIFDRYRAKLHTGRTTIAVIALWVMAFGALTELMQETLTQARSGDIADMATDWAGTLTTAAIAMTTRIRHAHKKTRL